MVTRLTSNLQGSFWESLSPEVRKSSPGEVDMEVTLSLPLPLQMKSSSPQLLSRSL